MGVNGTGKTTTIGKLACRLQREGSTRPARRRRHLSRRGHRATRHLGRRSGSELIHQKPGADPAAVVYDALAAARARDVDAVIVDTAGRLHTKSNLMAELEKMKRTAAKLVPGAPHDVLLVLDATTGQNGLARRASSPPPPASPASSSPSSTAPRAAASSFPSCANWDCRCVSWARAKRPRIWCPLTRRHSSIPCSTDAGWPTAQAAAPIR